MAAIEPQSASPDRPPKSDRWVGWAAFAFFAIAFILTVFPTLLEIWDFFQIPLTVLGALFAGAGLLVYRNWPPADRWAAWPAFAALVTALVLAFFTSLPGMVSFLLIPFAVFGAPLFGAGLIIVAVAAAVKRRPRMAASLLVAVLLPVLLWTPIRWTADCLHLGLTVWTGAGQLGRSSRPDGTPFEVLDWSVGLAGGPNTFLIYDVTDEIPLPPKLHKRPIASEQGWGEDCAGKATHLLGHYYVCTIG